MRGAGPAALLSGALGAVLLCLAEVTAIVRIEVDGAAGVTFTGADRHGIALVLLALAGLALCWLASTAHGGVVLAALGGLAAIGLVALSLWALSDLPDVGQRGSYGAGLRDATSAAGPGLWLELAGALALLGAAVWGLAALRARRGR